MFWKKAVTPSQR